ncbi:hypothetical protein QQ045_012351 [Rhodiola kirilowii]
MAKLFSKLFMKDKTDPADQEQMIVSTRSTRPAHFLFKIESFTRLSDIIVEADYESPEFECGGYKWKLSLYPKGNETRGRKSFIWKIDERSSWSDRIRYSDPFTALDYQWRLSLRPDGDGMYLGLVLHESHESSNMYVNCTLSRIVNGCSVQYGEQPSGCWFGESGNLNIGMRVPISYLIDGSKGYILKETAIFEATINCISKVIST